MPDLPAYPQTVSQERGWGMEVEREILLAIRYEMNGGEIQKLEEKPSKKGNEK